jgi:hypothetical protein
MSDLPAASFAHASEAEMARILDFYAVRWEYEPHTFPILWNLDGDVVESFSPDFFLPDLDLYLEMTTLKQRLVRKKNRKLRRLREMYPDLRIKLFYARDFRALMLKYGKVALVDELSGSSGHIVPDRLEVFALDEGVDVAGVIEPPIEPPTEPPAPPPIEPPQEPPLELPGDPPYEPPSPPPTEPPYEPPLELPGTTESGTRRRSRAARRRRAAARRAAIESGKPSTRPDGQSPR